MFCLVEHGEEIEVSTVC